MAGMIVSDERCWWEPGCRQVRRRSGLAVCWTGPETTEGVPRGTPSSVLALLVGDYGASPQLSAPSPFLPVVTCTSRSCLALTSILTDTSFLASPDSPMLHVPVCDTPSVLTMNSVFVPPFGCFAAQKNFVNFIVIGTMRCSVDSVVLCESSPVNTVLLAATMVLPLPPMM